MQSKAVYTTYPSFVKARDNEVMLFLASRLVKQ
jgi:hypothetical protein